MNNQITNCGLIALRNVSELKNISVRTLINISEDNGLTLYPYKLSKEDIKDISFPVILHFDNHFEYIDKIEQLAFRDITGYALFTTKQNYTEVLESEYKNITGQTWVAAGVASAELTYAGYNKIQANKKLKALQKQPLPGTTVSPELQAAYDRSLKMAGMGFTPEQAAAYHSNVGMQENTIARNAIDRTGGNLAGAINVGLQSNNIEGENKFAAEDADKRMRNIQYADNLARQIQEQRNMKSSEDRSYRIMEEQGYGLASKQASENITSSAGNIGTAVGGGLEQNKQDDMYKKLLAGSNQGTGDDIPWGG